MSQREEKIKLEENIEFWISNYINNFLNGSMVQLYKDVNPSKINSTEVQSIENISMFDYSCDFFVLFKVDGDYQFILINRTTKSIGIVDIGELVTYSRISLPFQAFLISSKGFSSEIGNFLTNEQTTERLLKYNDNSVIGFKMTSRMPDQDSILPVSKRNLFNGS
jgi:hypothetical protein